MNFTGVEESVGSVYLEPGVHEVKIVKTEFGKTPVKDTPYLKVFFEDRNGAGMNESFFLTPLALPRIQHLVSQFTGVKLSGEVSEASLNAKLVGKKARLLINGEKALNKDGVAVIYTRLPYAGFAQPMTDVPFSNLLVKIIDKTVGVPTTATAVEVGSFDDLPF